MTTKGRSALAGVGVVLAAVFSLAVHRAGGDAGGSRLIVHEWGTFTAVAGEDGTPVPWRALSDGEDLPRFVYARAVDGSAVRVAQPARIKPQLTAIVRLETPVVYFYAARETQVSLRVGLPGGHITEWYPAARVRGGEIAWDAVRVRPGGEDVFPEETAASHYYAARDTDAVPVRVETREGVQDERFLFYRGVGALPIPVLASLDRGRLLLQGFVRDPIPEVVVFENRGGSSAYAVRDFRSRSVTVSRPKGGHGIDALRSVLEAMLVRDGLYPREASAMVATWGDSWFEEGLRVFYVLPRPLADATLPMAIDPAPAELVRVMVVRTEILTREGVQRARAELAALPDDADADALAQVRRRLGRFGEPLLHRALEQTLEPRVRARIEAVLGERRSRSRLLE
jgi:hypothetical protein